MEMKQVYELANEITSEVLGEEGGIVKEDLSNVVDVGEKILNSEKHVENFTRTLVDRIGKTVFVNRELQSTVPNVLMDAWEYGSILQKVSGTIPDATENKSWELEDGVDYSQDIFKKPVVRQKFFDKRTTWEIPQSIADLQVKSAFADAISLNAFFSMLTNEVNKSLTIKNNGLVMRTLNHFIGTTLYDLSPEGNYSGFGNARAVNILALYNARTDITRKLTFEEMPYSPDFNRFFSYVIGLYIDRLSRPSTLFNIGGETRFTPTDKLHMAFLSDYYRASDVYLQSDVYHDNLTQLPKKNVTTIPFWQDGSQVFPLENNSKINITIGDENEQGTTHDIEADGILGVMWDYEALGVSNYKRRTTSHYNARAEFTNLWHKVEVGYFNDSNENFVVFYAA